MIYWRMQDYHKENKANESTKVFLDEVMWRDFMRGWCMKNGNKVFYEYGIYDRKYYNWKTDTEIVQKWRMGQTGYPIIDALMREMNATGYMPNRGRMIVACFFA